MIAGKTYRLGPAEALKNRPVSISRIARDHMSRISMNAVPLLDRVQSVQSWVESLFNPREIVFQSIVNCIVSHLERGNAKLQSLAQVRTLSLNCTLQTHFFLRLFLLTEGQRHARHRRFVEG